MAARFRHRLLVTLVATAAVAGTAAGPTAGPASASHAWNGFHWARTANPFTIKLGDNVSPQWDAVLATTSADWTASSVLDTKVVAGRTGTSGRCKPTTGRVEVCNGAYGVNGWLGLASVWTTGNHITMARVKLNDSYFDTPQFNTPAWRNLVSCQEVGHAFGLDHQDEIFKNPNLGTCMDYTNDPSTNQHPNTHDYDQLETIYGHVEPATAQPAPTVQSTSTAVGDDVGDWGRAIRTSSDGRSEVFVRDMDLDEDERLFTFVVWAR